MPRIHRHGVKEEEWKEKPVKSLKTKGEDKMKTAIILVLSTLLTSCFAYPKDDDRHLYDKYLKTFAWHLYETGSGHWSSTTYRELSKGDPIAAPKDVESFCPNYKALNKAERNIFWTAFIAALVRYESYFDTDMQYTEAFVDAKKRPIISRGLLQLSYYSAKGYGCKFYRPAQLHFPQLNLACGVKILKRWVNKDGIISGKRKGDWKGGARYWGALRRRGSLEGINLITRSNPICKNIN